MARRERTAAFGPPHDEEELKALRAAAEEVTLKKGSPPEVIAEAVITRWILERAVLVTAKRTGPVAFDLKNAKLRGFYAALLPQIGGALTHLPADKPFWELDKDEVLDIFIAGFQAAVAARVALLELDDDIPF